MKKHIQKESGFSIHKKSIPALKKSHYYVLDTIPLGDRPKDTIRVYRPGQNCRKRNKATWVPYIAKFGDKWYPNESLSEYLMNQIGAEMGLDMALSKLYLIDGQVRFCSQIFTSSKTSLVHAAQIYASWLNDDPDFVKGAERDENELFTFQFADKAIKHYLDAVSCHPNIFLDTMERLVELLAFDALIGNKDRHLYNWGLIVHNERKYQLQFSPIFDTSRGLFWNIHEDALPHYLTDKRKFQKYIDFPGPKMGWDSCVSLSHFDFIEKLFSEYPQYSSRAKKLLVQPIEAIFKVVLRKKCNNFFSQNRVRLIYLCLKERRKRLSTLLLPIE